MSRMSLSSLPTLFAKKSFYLLLSAVLIGLCAVVFSPTKKVSGQQTPQACPTCSQTIERTIYAPTIGLPEAAGADIVLNCRSIHEMEAVPTFYTEEGEAIVGETIHLQPAEIRFVTVESLIPAQHRKQHVWGGMSLSYTGMRMEVWAQITLRGAGQRESADVVFSVLNGTGSDKQEAVWWQPKPGKANIVLGNSSSSQIHTTLQFSDGDAQEVDIAPFATRYIRRNVSNGGGNTPEAGIGQSVKLTTIGPAGSLKATGYIISNSSKFASGIRFYDTQHTAQPNLFATNFRVKNSSSHLLLKNTTATILTARPRFRPVDGTGNPVELPFVFLSPGEIKEVDLQTLRTEAANRNDLDAVSVQIENDGAAGSLIGALYSTNQTTGVVYDVPLRDSGPLRNSTGAYPWRLDGDYSTNVTITNVGGETTQFRVSIYYNGGRYLLKPLVLAVGETAKYNLKKLRDEQTPDDNGNLIPLNATSGQFNWSIIRATNSTRLIGRSEVVSKSQNVSNSYSCNLACSDSGPYFDVPFVSLFAGDSVNTTVNEYWLTSYGDTSFSYPSSIPGLTTDYPDVATASMIQTGTMQVDGFLAGGAIWSSDYYNFYHYYEGPYDCYLENYLTNSSGPIEVVPINRGRIQAQGSNPPVEESYPWSQSAIPTKAEGEAWLDDVWNRLTSTQKRDRRRAYTDAKNYILTSPPEGRPFNGRGGKRFQDPARRDPSARIEIEIIVGLAFKDN